MKEILPLIIIVIIIVYISKQTRKEFHSRWASLLPNFKYSTQEFYDLVKTEMLNHEVEKLTYESVNLTTSHILSHRRMYLRVKWEDYHYDLCFAPFGDGCFVSWWLMYNISTGEEIFSKFPLIGGWIVKSFYHKTYYQIDSASMFMTYAQKSVLAVIDDITKGTGIRLTELDRKPILSEINKRI